MHRMSGKDRLAILLSFLVTSTLGAALISRHWQLVDAPEVAWGRSAGFVVIMAGVHFVVFRVHQRPSASEREQSVRSWAASWPVSSRYGWLVVACSFLALAIHEFNAGYELRARILASGRSLESVPPTLLSQRPATGVAMSCIGLILVLIACRRAASIPEGDARG
jgi:hypothetical protein